MTGDMIKIFIILLGINVSCSTYSEKETGKDNIRSSKVSVDIEDIFFPEDAITPEHELFKGTIIEVFGRLVEIELNIVVRLNVKGWKYPVYSKKITLIPENLLKEEESPSIGDTVSLVIKKEKVLGIYHDKQSSRKKQAVSGNPKIPSVDEIRELKQLLIKAVETNNVETLSEIISERFIYSVSKAAPQKNKAQEAIQYWNNKVGYKQSILNTLNRSEGVVVKANPKEGFYSDNGFCIVFPSNFRENMRKEYSMVAFSFENGNWKLGVTLEPGM